jgi:NDP-sugar pyrophosphorylase family protein
MAPASAPGKAPRTVQALILAAGLGTRLGSLTTTLPKCMVPLNGQPLVERLVRWLHVHGVDDVAINLHHCPDAITGHLGTGIRFGVEITYSYEEQPLGTAGAVRRLEAHFDGPFLVVYGDGYTNLDLSRVLRLHAARRQPGRPHVTMVLFRVPDPSACGIVDLDGDGLVRRFVEKPAPDQVFSDLASAGIFICERPILDLIPADGPSDFGRDVLPRVLELGIPIYGEPLAPGEFLIDVGTPEAYARACAHAELAGSAPIAPAAVAG